MDFILPNVVHCPQMIGILWESQRSAPTLVERESTNLAHCSRSSDVIITWVSMCAKSSLLSSSSQDLLFVSSQLLEQEERQDRERFYTEVSIS
jgi:hypothetical protein